MNKNIVFGNTDLRKIILEYIISKKCKYCKDKIKSGNTCISCLWNIENPNLLYILRTSR